MRTIEYPVRCVQEKYEMGVLQREPEDHRKHRQDVIGSNNTTWEWIKASWRMGAYVQGWGWEVISGRPLMVMV